MAKLILLLTVASSLLAIQSCCDSTGARTGDPFDTALAKVDLTKDELTFDYGDMSNFGGDKFVLPLFYTLHSDFFKIENYSKAFEQSVTRNAGSLKNLIGFSSIRLDEGVRRGLIGDPLESAFAKLEQNDVLYNAIVSLHSHFGRHLTSLKKQALRRQSGSVPVELQKIAALLVYSSIDTLDFRTHAFERTFSDFDLGEMYSRSQTVLASDEDIVDFSLERFAENVDFPYLYAHAQDLAYAVDYACDSMVAEIPDSGYSFFWESPLGAIVINDKRNDYYPHGAYHLILDAGGNDTYEGGGATVSETNWISILIDLNGDDTYRFASKDTPTFGAGVMGYAFLVDMKGNDVYEGHNVSGGVGMFGVGVLQDRDGNDTYDGYICAQGTGQFGIGILSDLGGDDNYHMYLLGQGFGFTKGMGILVDLEGNDDYYADTLDIKFPASQTKNYNSNLAQGVGFGKRADYIDGHSWAGGIGMLVDAQGDDTYSAGLFAQGCAYWYAIGLLMDNKGNDTYNGVWYVQGSGAHFGLGVLIDSSGNDHYKATMNMAQGAGHDFTLGVLIDEQGNDVHDAPNLSLGGGNANGIGIFWDKAGDDIYSVSAATTLGRSNVASRGGLRDRMLCLGLFLDTGGDDSYPDDNKYDFARNNQLWQQFGTNTEQPLDSEKGAGYDCEWSEGTSE